jgi:hypothetical protein
VINQDLAKQSKDLKVKTAPWTLQKDGPNHDQVVAPTFGVGKHVPSDLEHHPKFGSSLFGGVVEKEQKHDLGASVLNLQQRRDECLAAEMNADRPAMLHSFTDRLVRAQDGQAIKTLVAGDGLHHFEREEPEKKVDNSVMVAAGQGSQVNSAGKSASAYQLQTEWTGIGPKCQTLSATVPGGRSTFAGEQAVSNSMQASRGVGSALRAEPFNDDLEAERSMRKQLGCRRITSPRLDSSDPILGDDISERSGKRINMAARAVNDPTGDSGVLRIGFRDACSTKQGRLPRSAGLFKEGCSTFTENHNRKYNDIFRYECDYPHLMPPVGLKRAVSAPPTKISLAHSEVPLEPPFSPSLKPRRQGSMEIALRIDTPEELAVAREQRQQEDTQFAHKCKETSVAYAEMRNVKKSTVERVHHMGSSAVAAQLCWE